MTGVINLRDAAAVEKATTDGTFCRVDRRTRYGNPFVIGSDGSRGEVIAKYREWVLSSEDDEAQWIRDNMYDLRGKTLACWCAPLACHADVLTQLANETEAQ